MALVTAAAVISALGVGSALAVDDHEFQLDGNTADDAAAAADFDWESFFDGSGASVPALPDASRPGFTASGFEIDNAGEGDSSDGSTFATGSKDTLDISGWQCGFSNNIGDKVDIINAYSAVYTVPSGPEAGDTILYFGVEKSSPTGSSNIAVWFLQDRTVDCDSPNGNVDFTGNHTDGDLLVVSEFTDGGRQANVKAYEWVGGADGALNPDPVATGGTCATGGAEDDACAIANAAPVNPPWPHPDKDTREEALGVNQFFEGGVNLNNAGLLDACFARFLANTRSAPSLTATIFDFASGELETCAPSTSLALSTNPATPSGAAGPTVHAGDSVTITFTETNDGINPLTSPSVTTDNAGCTPAYASGDGGTIGTLDVGESWVFTCTMTNVQGTVTVNAVGHGIDPLGQDVSWTSGCVNGEVVTSTTPDVLCDQEETGAVTITVINPSTSLTKTASVAVTYTYTEANDSGDGTELTKPTAGWVTDNQCSPVTETLGSASDGLPSDATHNIGDADNDGKLDDGETFTLTCTRAATTSGTNVDVTNRAVGHGIDSLGADITWCASTSNRPTPAAPATSVRCDPDEADEVRVRVEHLNRPAQGA